MVPTPAAPSGEYSQVQPQASSAPLATAQRQSGQRGSSSRCPTFLSVPRLTFAAAESPMCIRRLAGFRAGYQAPPGSKALRCATNSVEFKRLKADRVRRRNSWCISMRLNITSGERTGRGVRLCRACALTPFSDPEQCLLLAFAPSAGGVSLRSLSRIPARENDLEVALFARTPGCAAWSPPAP